MHAIREVGITASFSIAIRNVVKKIKFRRGGFVLDVIDIYIVAVNEPATRGI